jgi:hypothetical protein
VENEAVKSARDRAERVALVILDVWKEPTDVAETCRRMQAKLGLRFLLLETAAMWRRA